MKKTISIASCLFILLYAAFVLADGGGSGSAGEYGHLDDEFQPSTQAIESENYTLAIIELDKLNGQHPDDADVLNLLGYSHRKLKDYEQAETYYLQALAIEPKHRGANEYLGELYLETDRLDLAEQRLNVLDKACFLPCKQYRKLKKAVKEYKATHG